MSLRLDRGPENSAALHFLALILAKVRFPDAGRDGSDSFHTIVSVDLCTISTEVQRREVRSKESVRREGLHQAFKHFH